jgi:hypothetical protein
MVRAAVTGAIDFTRADPQDTWWWIKTNLVLEEVSRQDRMKWLTANHQHWCAMVAHGNLEGNGFTKAQNESHELVEKVAEVLFPWRDRRMGQQELVKMWIENYGDPNTPEVQAMIDEAVAAINAVPVNMEDAEE